MHRLAIEQCQMQKIIMNIHLSVHTLIAIPTISRWRSLNLNRFGLIQGMMDPIKTI